MRFPDVKHVGAIGAACVTATLAGCGGPFPQSSLHPDSNAAWVVQHLFTTIFWWAVAVFVIVEGLLIFAVLRFRGREGEARPPAVHGHTGLEIGWTLAPAVILVVIAIPSIRAVWKLDRPAGGPALQVEVTGHQWWWEFRYPDLGVVTANELHVPVGQTVNLTLKSADVIHSFWVPRVSGKRDVVPTHENDLWFRVDSAGVYTGQCAEFCGRSHALMGTRLVAQTPDDFQAWVTAERQPAAEPAGELAREGEQVFLRSACIGCHRINGTVAQGVIGPDLTHVGSRSTLAAATLDNTSDELARWLRDPGAVKPGALMPNLNLSEDDVARLVAYLESLK